MTTPQKSKRYFVYRHTFPNNKVYIGITCQKPSLRWRGDGSGYKPKSHTKAVRVWNAIQKYGWDNVGHDILFSGLTKEEAEKKEVLLIALYNSTDDRYGYNIASGGSSQSPSERTRKKISESRMGKNYGLVGENAPMYGKHHSDETKEKIRIATTGVNNPMYGTHHSDVTKNLLREAHSDECKIVAQKDKSGNTINVFPSIHFASKETGINRVCISQCVQGIAKTAGGFVWEQQ